MIEAYIITLLGLSLIGHTRDAMHEKKMLKKLEIDIAESVADNHPANAEGKSGGKLSIYLSHNHRNWILRYNYPNENGAGSVLSSEELSQKSVVKPREGTLKDYRASLKAQRKALIDFVKPEIEDNNKTGRLATAGFGAGDIMYNALYTDENLKWRSLGGYWNSSATSDEVRKLQELGWIDK